ncbi:MAG: hypothetical protein BJ554DRAFT_297 [Olpidium bornovanus]|uniref:Dynactin subunit 4 n=1 Tax=Olpidium bornovanus TaxID=278681 RepID=A0A8H7ZTN0_9FUNG|nr:MAG: hypothetical protein BJ554DRAFT_297 [Olpidium bornovanus]
MLILHQGVLGACGRAGVVKRFGGNLESIFVNLERKNGRLLGRWGAMARPADAEAPTWAAPFVHYQCPCWRSGAFGGGKAEEGAAGRGEDAARSPDAPGPPADPAAADAPPGGSVRPLRPLADPLSGLAEFAYLPLSRLYFCEDSMQVVSDELPTGAQPALITVAQGPYYLACPCCRWHSKEIGLEFEKPNWLSSVVQKLEESKPDFVEFEKLSQHYSAHLKSLAPLTKAPPHYVSSFAGSPSSRHVSPYLQQYYQRTALGKQQPDLPRYEPVTTTGTEDVDEELLSEIMSEIDVTKGASIVLLLPFPHLLGFRIKMVALYATRAPDFIVPTAAFSNCPTHFLCYRDYVPTVTLSGLPETIAPGNPFTVVLTFTNPLYQSINVRLSLPSVASPGTVSEGKDDVTLVAPEFSVAPYSDVWVYEQFRDAGTSSLGDVEEDYTYDPDEKSGSPTGKIGGTADGMDSLPAATTERKLPRRSRSHAFCVSIGIGHKIED